MSDPATAVAAAPFIDAVMPYVVTATSAVVSYLAVQALATFSRWTGAKIDATYATAIEAAAANEAGKLVAGALGNLATAQIDVRNPSVAYAANTIVAASNPLLKKAVAATGLTPELAASLIVGQIGRLQATMTSAAPAAKP